MESKSGSSVLYHKTGIENVLSILRSKSLKLAPTEFSTIEIGLNRNYAFHFSFGRTTTAKYNRLRYSQCQLVFDGSVLGSRYKIVALDYWGEAYRKAADGDYEQEDRLLHDKRSIPLIGLQEIHCPVTSMSDQQKRQLRSLALLCKRSSVKLYVYMDLESAQRLNRGRSVPLAALDLKTTKPITRYRDSHDRRNTRAHAIVELFLKKPGQQLSKRADELLRYTPSYPILA
tara:strand:- start:41 stop:730 length:690 start_codon:yes stop_codon:yes gene_type:complete